MGLLGSDSNGLWGSSAWALFVCGEGDTEVKNGVFW